MKNKPKAIIDGKAIEYDECFHDEGDSFMLFFCKYLYSDKRKWQFLGTTMVLIINGIMNFEEYPYYCYKEL